MGVRGCLGWFQQNPKFDPNLPGGCSVSKVFCIFTPAYLGEMIQFDE